MGWNRLAYLGPSRASPWSIAGQPLAHSGSACPSLGPAQPMNFGGSARGPQYHGPALPTNSRL
ncbi:hypothetical protein TorRG33x02_328690, partial [Trema orientale]